MILKVAFPSWKYNGCLAVSSLPIEAEGRIYASVKHTNIGSDNGLRLAGAKPTIWKGARILLTGSLGANFSVISIEICKLSFTKMH